MTTPQAPPGGAATGRRILVVGPSWVGDTVMAQSMFKVLRTREPSAVITVMAPAWCLELLERMPEVNQSVLSPFGHGELRVGDRFRLARQMNGQFDTAIILPNSFKSALVPWFAGVPERVGWQGEWRNPLLTDCRKLVASAYPLMVQRFVALALAPGTVMPDPIPLPSLDCNRARALAVAADLQLPRDHKVLALCPGAEFGDAKQWPPEHFARLCDKAVEAGWKIWILGSPREAQTGNSILACSAPATRQATENLAGRTSLGMAMDLLSLADAVVTNDSGLMHVAAAVGTPLVALYGSTSPDFTPPLSERVESLSTDISCRPCFERNCPLGHKRCLTEISPERVYHALLDLVMH